METPPVPNPELITSRAEFEAKAESLAKKYHTNPLTIIELFAHSMDVDITELSETEDKFEKLYNNSFASNAHWRYIDEQLAHEEEKKAREAAEKNALTDALTGLDNRGSLDKHLARLAETHKRSVEGQKDPFSLILIDLDNFKQINDQLGHPAGDRVLKAVAGVVKKETRESELAARFGGEEIAVVINGSVSDATGVAERMRKAIEKIDLNELDIDTSLRPNVTASIGVSEYMEESTSEDSLTTLLKRADDALYIAKKEGKNQVQVA